MPPIHLVAHEKPEPIEEQKQEPLVEPRILATT